MEGPASVMDKLESLQTMPIDIQGATGDVTVEPKIDYQGMQVKDHSKKTYRCASAWKGSP